MSAFGTAFDDQYRINSSPPRQESSGFMDYLLPFPDSDPDIARNISVHQDLPYAGFMNPPPPPLPTPSGISSGSFSMNGNSSPYDSQRIAPEWASQSAIQYPDFLGAHGDSASDLAALQREDQGGQTAFESHQSLPVPIQPVRSGRPTSQPSLIPTNGSTSSADDWVECTEATVRSLNHIGRIYRVQGWSPSANDNPVTAVCIQAPAPSAQMKRKSGAISKAAAAHQASPQAEASHLGVAQARTGQTEMNTGHSRKPSQTKWARRSGMPGPPRKKGHLMPNARGSDPTGAGRSQSPAVPSKLEEVPSDFSIKLHDPWASVRNSMSEKAPEAPVSAPPTTQFRFSDVARLQPKPSPHLARLITLAASKTFGVPEQGDCHGQLQYPTGNTGQGEQFPQVNVNIEGPETGLLANSYPNFTSPGPYGGEQLVYPQGDTCLRQSIPPTMGRPSHALEFSASTRRRALQRSTTFGPNSMSGIGIYPPQADADQSAAAYADRPFPGPYHRTVSESVVPQLSFTSVQPQTIPHTGSIPRTLLDDIAAVTAPPSKKLRFS